MQCKIEGCKQIAYALGFCHKHYDADRRSKPEVRAAEAAQQKGYRALHGKEIYAQQQVWKHTNWVNYRAYLNSRKKRVRIATPGWADLGAIREFYRNCPPGYAVDHIVPLNGKVVCGLHVSNNLQYLTKQANMEKSNKFRG